MDRREFLSRPVITATMAASSASAQQIPTFDVVLKGGHVIDPANRLNREMDVAVLDGKIARVDRDIPASQGKTTVNVSGYYVTPGLIDRVLVKSSCGQGMTCPWMSRPQRQFWIT